MVSIPGAEFMVEVGQSWLSRLTIQEDILRATGKKYSYSQIDRATDYLEMRGFITDSKPIAGGAYGKVYTLSDSVLCPTDDDYNPVERFRKLTYGELSEFKFTKFMSVDSEGRRTVAKTSNPKSVESMVQKHPEGLEFHMLSGRWKRSSNVADPDAEVYLPWLILDIDRPYVIDAYRDVERILDLIKSDGVPLSRVLVTMSGNGFHVRIPTAIFGSPAFQNSDLAYDFMRWAAEYLTDGIEFDSGPLSPLKNCRMVGSIGSTGQRTFTVTGEKFRSTPPDDFFKLCALGKPHTHTGVSAAVEHLPDLLTEWNKGWRPRRKSKGGIGPVISAVLEGVEQGGDYGGRATGRECAAFLLAAFMMDDPKRVPAVAQRLGLPSNSDLNECMFAWNYRCTPSLSEPKLKRQIRGASQKTSRSRHR